MIAKVIRDGDGREQNTLEQLVRVVLNEVGIEDNQKTVEEHKNLLMQAFFELGLRLRPGVHRLIRHLRDHNIPIAIATNGALVNTYAFCEVIPEFDISIFDHVTSGTDHPEVINNKPATDIYMVCAKDFKSPPKSLKDCVVFEDSITGIKGAVASGMKTVLVYEMWDKDFDDIIEKVTSVVDSFENFKPESVGLPPYEST